MSTEDKSGLRIPLLFMVVLYVVISLFLLGLGGAWGWLLHRFWPAIETGTGVLIGVFVSGAALHLLIKALGAVPAVIEEAEEEEEEQVFIAPSRRRRRNRRSW